MLRFYCNPPRTSISTPSYRYMRTKCPFTEITRRNAKNSTLDPYNFFLAGFCYTIFYHKSGVYIYRSFIQSLVRYCAAKKKSFFYVPPLITNYTLYLRSYEKVVCNHPPHTLLPHNSNYYIRPIRSTFSASTIQ